MQQWLSGELVVHRTCFVLLIIAGFCFAEADPFTTKDFVNKIFSDTPEPVVTSTPKPFKEKPVALPTRLPTTEFIEPLPSPSQEGESVTYGKPVISVYVATSVKGVLISVLNESEHLRKKGIEINLALVGSPVVMAHPDVANGLLAFEANGGRYQAILEVPKEVIEKLGDKKPARSPLWVLEFSNGKKLILSGVISITERFNSEGEYYESSAT